MLVMHQLQIITMLLTSQIVKTHSKTCEDRVSMNKKFSLRSFRNNTGHWMAKMAMLHEPGSNDDIKAKNSPWNLDVNFERERCNGVEFQKIEALITVPPMTPGPDYVFYADMGYYKFHPELKTWHEARDICQREGAHLAIVNSDKESNLFKEMFQQQSGIGKYAFIGFHDLKTEGQYITVFDEPLNSTGFTEFAKGEPGNQKSEEDCGGVNRDGKLNDIQCTVKSPFICEQES